MGKSIEELLFDLKPLTLYLAGTSSYKKLRFSISDMESFYIEKLYDVWLKYHEHLPYAEVKAIGIASLYNYRGKLYKKYSRELPLADYDARSVEVIEDESDRDVLSEAVQYLSNDQALVLEMLVDPPFYIVDRVNIGKRIPSHIILEFLDMPHDSKSVKAMNTFRRGIFQKLESSVPQCT